MYLETDFVSDFTAGLYGHSHPVIKQAVKDALATGFSLGGVVEKEAQLGEILQTRFKSIERVRFCNSGTEANTFALATAKAFTGRNKILVFDGGYHGGTISFHGTTSNPMNLPHEFVVGAFNDIERTQSLVDDTLAAILIEPMQMAGGVRPASIEFLRFLRESATKVGAVLIFDEVVTSRLHYHGLQGAREVYPDMTTLGKYLGGGFPFGAFGGRADIMEQFNPIAHGRSVLHHSGTFNNNIFTMTAAVAAAELVTEQSLAELNKLGDDLRATGNSIVQQAGLKDIVFVGYGSTVGMGFLGDRGQVLREVFYFTLVKQGILMGRRGFLCLNLAHTKEHIDRFLDVVKVFAEQHRADCDLSHRILSNIIWWLLGTFLVRTDSSNLCKTQGNTDIFRGWIIPNVILIPEVLAIAELASSMPVNGSFYWWAGALAPPGWSHAISFVTGWLNVFTMFASTASFAYAVASSLSYAVTIAAPSMAWTNAQIMCLSLAVIVVWSGVMTLKLERIASVYIAMVQNRPFASARTVFGEYTNFSDWGLGVSVPYSWFCTLWVNSAWMVPVYVAEETHDASREIPKSLWYTFSVTAVIGMVICLVSAFCINDIEAAAADERHVFEDSLKGVHANPL
ncbi:unnamed protein product [Aspergillus oryzae]|uniref:Unnamed protein product n=1 Tax=Aspergillus oryzae TaxID=5062 RepID=A0AAN5BXP9_ASPOZ|nr:unnamed protein product [Aspergillus oryzae]GMF86520.1 unnamed protein product [Aspergillus oryzae]GMG29357.1 unnamed protein product [Aspergillus oryzae]